MFAVERQCDRWGPLDTTEPDHDQMEHDHVRQRHSIEAFRAIRSGPSGWGGEGRDQTCPRIAAGLRVEADVVDVCPPRPARIKGYNERSRRAGHRRDAQRTRMGESLHRWAVSTLIPCRLRASVSQNTVPVHSSPAFEVFAQSPIR
jgi:hypothetical protein